MFYSHICVCRRGFSKEFDPCIDQVVLATLDIYKASLLNLLPTPTKCHYMFNLRDFSRVIQVCFIRVIFLFSIEEKLSLVNYCY